MVFYISMAIALGFVVWGFISPTTLGSTASLVLGGIVDQFGWVYLVTALGILLFSLFIAFSKFGKIRLGEDSEKPEYSNFAWFSMLFSAGMGIGLVFWGVAEPMYHYLQPPLGITPESAESAVMAMRFSFFHWGFHPWAMYAVVGLALAYVTFRKKKACLISSTLYPLLGEKSKGAFGSFVDIMAILVTIFGVATSLGLGALQVNGGLSYLFGVPVGYVTQIIIIVAITLLFVLSATSGIDKGIKTLSNANIALATAIMVLVLLLGPTSFIFEIFTQSLGGYVQNILEMSLRITPIQKDPWISAWTIFYWAWWISWSPFVGTFIARISRGRTIKEFVLGVLVLPAIFCFIWFSVLGGTALNFEIVEGLNISEAVLTDISTGLFATLSHIPFGSIISFAAIFLITTFFITSADSATFVLSMFSSKGDLNPKNSVKILWGVVQSMIAIVLLISGGLSAMQSISIIMALPFLLIVVLMCISIFKAVKEEYN
ncbi:glycine betaine uptake BCCT transporter [Alkalibacter mobilis]|uniref:glycine betaine uptake BCCT transporter n=1 Tax=Alkalibacter mobilis TaxID=2787712 RepID=UPI00189CBA63|nr:BCCT family transporter [Alkalibacter mobilis]MBF7096380.1 BCCT family transporter [Alkalibacter mobilis]